VPITSANPRFAEPAKLRQPWWPNDLQWPLSARSASFLGAGLFQRPSLAQAVDALAFAYREVSFCRARGGSVRQWLAGEVHHRGIRENAAVLTAMEIPDFRNETAQAYVLEYPGRRSVLEDMLAALT
jgi:hypothetical protein